MCKTNFSDRSTKVLFSVCAIAEANTDRVVYIHIARTIPEKRYTGNLSSEKCDMAKVRALIVTATPMPYFSYSAATIPRKRYSSVTAGSTANATIRYSTSKNLPFIAKAA